MIPLKRQGLEYSAMYRRIHMGQIIEAYARAKLNGVEMSHLTEIESRIDQYKTTAARAFTAYWNLLHAEMMLDVGDIIGAIEKIDGTLSLGIEMGEHVWDAELHRLKGIALSHHGDGDLNSAIGCVQQAVNAARSQGASMLQLRALCSLIELKEGSDARNETGELQLVYDQCQQDPTWPDIATAGRLLAMHKH